MSTSAVIARTHLLCKSFGNGSEKTQILHDVSLEARENELLMLLGPSGCGKTTLISIIAGTLKADAGELEVLGHDLRKLPGRAITRFRADNIGFIFQQFNLIPTISCEENASVPLLIQGMAMGKAVAQARLMLEKVGLAAHGKKRPNQLSGGQQQRVAIARALVHSPRLIICDEPTAALDAENGRLVMQILRDLVLQPGRGAIVVTHDHRILSYSDRIASMNDGRVLHTLPTAEFLHQAASESLNH